MSSMMEVDGHLGVIVRPGRQTTAWEAVPPYEGIRTVDIELMPSGRIVIAWRAEPDAAHHADMGSILCATSSDEGLSWSPPIMIARADAEWAYANVVLFQHDGTLFAFVGRCPSESAHSDRQTIVSRISRDEGRTWEDGGIDMQYHHSTIGGGKVMAFRNRFLMPFHRSDKHPKMSDRAQNTSFTRLHGVLVSSDLRSWHLGGIVPQDSQAFLQEGFLVSALDGTDELLLVMREGDWDFQVRENGDELWSLISQTHCSYVSRSKDGIHWTPAVPWPEIPNFNTKGAFLNDSLGHHVAFFNDAPDRQRLFVMAGRSGAWSVPLLLAGDGGWNCYAMAVEAGETHPRTSRLLVAYESGKRRVVFQELFISSAP